MPAIERKVLPADHDDIIGSRDWLAGLHLEREDFAAARATRQEGLEILRKLHGPSHWRVTDARQTLQDVERRSAMTRDQRQKLAEAGRLNREIVALNRAGRSSEALASARHALAINKAVLGERHPDTATSLNNLAFVLWVQRDYAGVVPLLKEALTIAQDNLKLAAAAQSERQQLAMAGGAQSGISADQPRQPRRSENRHGRPRHPGYGLTRGRPPVPP
jgi:tetratricopeptide (TPR) repeat protein